MFIFIVPDFGSLKSQDAQFISLKRGTTVKLDFMFYKDAAHAVSWNLSALDRFSITAQEFSGQNTYDIEYNKDSEKWDFSNAVNGIVSLTLEVTQNIPQSMYAEITFQLYAAELIYKTSSFIIEVVGDLEIA